MTEATRNRLTVFFDFLTRAQEDVGEMYRGHARFPRGFCGTSDAS